MQKTKTIRLSDFIEVKRPIYTFIKIVPDKSIRNYTTDKIGKSITYLYNKITKRIRIEQKKLFFETKFHISYIIDIRKNDVMFYFQVPKVYQNLIVEKIKECWPKATIETGSTFEELSKDLIAYQLKYKNEDPLSLRVDRRSNEPLNSILNVIDIMEYGDRVVVSFNFIPTTQLGWRNQCKETFEKYIQKKSVLKEKTSLEYITRSIVLGVISFLDAIIDTLGAFVGAENSEKDSLSEVVSTLFVDKTEISGASRRKKELRILENQIVVLSTSLDKVRRLDNANAVCQAFKVIDEDNELNYKKIKGHVDLNDYKYTGVESNLISTDEVTNFIQAPAKELFERFNINHILTNETPVPEILQKGYFSLGYSTFKGNTVEAFLMDDYNTGNLPLLLLGAQGVGKTTYLANVINFAAKNNEGAVLIDYIKNCELSDEIENKVPKDKLIIIDLSKEEQLQGLGFNELVISKDFTSYEKMNIANLKEQYTLALIDSINPDTPLTASMRRVLSSACYVVFVAGFTSIRDVVNCLESHTKRKYYINLLNDEEKLRLSDEIESLKSLDEYDKKGEEVIGTRSSKIDFILDRINLLKEDVKLKIMFNTDTDNNIDLVEALENKKIVLFKMPQNEFPGKVIKNVMVTYLISKVWASCIQRGKIHKQPNRVHLVIDELFQAPTALKLLEGQLTQTRKYGLKTILSGHNLRQIEPIADMLSSSGCSYMLMKGTLEKDFNTLSCNIEGYDYEDLRDMKKYHSLNVIYAEDKYFSFITRLTKSL